MKDNIHMYLSQQLTLTPTLFNDIRVKQATNSELVEIRRLMEKGKGKNFCLSEDGSLPFEDCLCILKDETLREQILSEAHEISYAIYPGSTKMYNDLKRSYWWQGLKRYVAKFVSRCMTFQQVKAEHQRPRGVLQPIQISEWKWKGILMNFIICLPKTMNGNDAIWVNVDRLTKSAYILAIKTTITLEQLAQLYVKEIIKLHSIPKSIISDRDSSFTSHFWKYVQ